MSVSRNLGVLAIAAGVCIASVAQQPAGPPPAAPGLTDTPTAPPNNEATRLAGIARDDSRMFGSDPDNPGPLATDLSPALTPAAIEKATRKVADWELANYGQYFDIVDRSRQLDGRIWTWAALYDGYMAASSEFGEGRYRDAMEKMGKSYNWELITRPPALPNADNQSIAQVYLELYLTDKDPAEIAPTRTALDGILVAPRVDLTPATSTANPGHRIEWWWCDALFMAPPVWARMYAATGDPRYISYLDQEWAKTSALLYQPKYHLYARDASFIGKTDKNGEPIFWGRGEGWVIAGLARTLQYLPKDDPTRATYEAQMQQMAAALAKLQRPDGTWTASLLDPTDYPAPEISGTSLITYGMAWGINNGILDSKVYKPVVAHAWDGMLHHIYADGRLGDIQQTGAAPSMYKPSASYDYGVGGFLLAGSELHKMVEPKSAAGKTAKKK